ncbi:MAG TPA: exodeoxyribonuclease VII large subunit [Verrucomicrobiae bacterium]|jgi:exodeoxyribonuclease VII large subunit|nr:exodeoxyribonuclease VII large subunit [Verrucomicrobiae bacterium]
MNQTSLFDLTPERRVWRVSELTERISELLERAFTDVWVEGEVSNCREAQSGHIYFTLKDARSQIRCVCFRDQLRGIRCRPEDGLHITVRGSLGVYEPRGEYQVYVSYIEPVGLGALQLAFEQLKKKLQAEGLFDDARKRPLPVLPRCIGVVSSPKGAAIRDILRVLKRRFANVHVQLYPVKVQGAGAAGEIVVALRHFNRVKFADVLIVARGGGSLEDLWAFNEEIVARAIAESVIPVITGVGHETDFTIADFVSDVRAPTPSAAAEIVLRSRQEFERHIAEHQLRLVRQTRYLLSERRHRVRDLETHRGFRQLEVLVRGRRQQLDELSASLAVVLRTRLAAARHGLTKASTQISSFDLRGRAGVLRRRIEQQREALRAALERAVTGKRRDFTSVHLRFSSLDPRPRLSSLRRRFEQSSAEMWRQFDRSLISRRRKLEALALQLEERSPLRLLERGYAIAYDVSGNVLRSPDQVAIGEDITVQLARGQLDASVRRKKKEEI